MALGLGNQPSPRQRGSGKHARPKALRIGRPSSPSHLDLADCQVQDNMGVVNMSNSRYLVLE